MTTVRIIYSPDDDGECGMGWYYQIEKVWAGRGYWDTSKLFSTRDEAQSDALSHGYNVLLEQTTGR